MKDIKDYLHLYLGCECMVGDLTWKPETNLHGLAPGVDVNYGRPIRTTIDAHILNAYPHQTTLILRPLSDMTEEEKESHEMVYMRMQDIADEEGYICDAEIWAETTRWLISKGFDVFQLIEAGLAIDKTTLKQTA